MPEEISVQILSQASENIQKLFDLSTRIDERVKQINANHESIDRKIEDITRRQMEMMQKVAVLEAKSNAESQIVKNISECEDANNSIDKRVTILEGDQGRQSARWDKIATFVIQIVWVILAAYLLTKLNLQAPAVP